MTASPSPGSASSPSTDAESANTLSTSAASVSTPPWWTSAVVYQIYPRSFADGNGDGIGDLPGARAHLDHIARLGADVVWLSPVYRSPMDDNGYDISNYEDVDPLFGTMADLEGFIADAHARGIKVVMDLVVNHTSDEHPWFLESRSSRDNPKRDWYWWRPPRAADDPPPAPDPTPGTGDVVRTPGTEHVPPTPWRSIFAGSAWQYDEANEEYYLHYFSRRQPDLNWENPQVRAEIYAMMNRWLDRGVSGFRMDVINLISKDPSLPDDFWYFDGPRIHEFLHEMHEAVFAGRRDQLLLVGETPATTLEQAQLYTDQAREELDMVFQFEHVDLDSGPGGKYDVIPLALPTLKKSLARWQDGLAERGWNSLYWDNHDQPRAVSRFGDDSPQHRVRSAKALATVLHLHRGTPYVYQGEELGMTNAPIASIDDVDDIEARGHFTEAVANGADPEVVLEAVRVKGRDNARTPMHWDDSEHAGFSTGTPWLPVNSNHREINAAVQVDDPDSVFAHYRRLIALRHEDPTVALGDYRLLLADHPAIFAFTRTRGDDELLVLSNWSDTEQEVDLTEVGGAAAYDDATLVSTNQTVDGEPEPTRAPAILEAWEAVVLRRRR